jgi:phosphatidate cytidylyltransferase
MAIRRTISGLILLGVITASIFVPSLHWVLLVLICCAALIGVDEYCRIVSCKQKRLCNGESSKVSSKHERHFEDVIACLLVVFLLIDGIRFSLHHFLAIMILALTVTGICYVLCRDPKESLYGTANTIFGGLWVGIPMSLALMILRKEKEGYLILGFFLAIIFATDLGAYIIGSNFGRHKLCPNLSPKKTIEGSLGGFVFAILAGLLCFGIFHLLHKPLFRMGEMLLLGAVSGITSQFGDLVESAFKRDAGVKDSGNILSGHGGILDRIDSVLFSLPLLYLYLVIFPR